MNIDLVKNSLEYYDRNMERYQKFINKIKYLVFNKTDSEMEHDTVAMFDEHKNAIHTSRYENIGVYTMDSSIWVWAWSVPTLKKNTTYIISKILNYGIKLSPQDKFLKTELVTSRFKISTKVQLDIHAAIASYLAKSPFILSYVYIDSKEIGDSDPVKYRQFDDLHDLDKLPQHAVVYFLFLMDLPDIDED
jgi:hypothetical protein